MKLPKWNDQQALMDFWGEVHRAPTRTARALFERRHTGYVADTRYLANAAANRAAELGCRRCKDETAGDCYQIAVRVCTDALTPFGLMAAQEAKWRW